MIRTICRRLTEHLRLTISPHSLYITQGGGSERPFTGAHWWVKDVGNYHCVVCDQMLYPSHYKFFPPTGKCAFFASEDRAVNITEDTQRLRCSQCASHLGVLLPEGPAPTHLHHEVESGALVFKEKPWFVLPPTRKSLRMAKKQLN